MRKSKKIIKKIYFKEMRLIVKQNKHSSTSHMNNTTTSPTPTKIVDNLFINDFANKVAEIVEDTHQHKGQTLFHFTIFVDKWEEGSLSDWKLTSPWFSLADDGTVLQYPNPSGNHKKDSSWVVSTDNNGNPISKPPPFCQIHSGVQSFIKAWAKWNHISDIDWINIMLINSSRSRNEDDLRESHGLDVTVYAMIIDPIDPKNHSIESNCGIFNGNVLISQSRTNHKNGSRIIKQLAKFVQTLSHVVFA